jgi:hypothetical protein
VLMHMRGTPQTMQSTENTVYTDVCAEVAAELQVAGAPCCATLAGSYNKGREGRQKAVPLLSPISSIEAAIHWLQLSHPF